MSYLDLTRRIHKTIQNYYPDGNINFEESVLAVRSIELSLFTAFTESIVKSAANTAEPITQPLKGDKSKPADICSDCITESCDSRGTGVNKCTGKVTG